uniref:Uncharacterized protein n=1 Tax=Arundo donax TaxID=35708 RepID=A0A0A9FFI4_ARUDO
MTCKLQLLSTEMDVDIRINKQRTKTDSTALLICMQLLLVTILLK